jgi:glycosyltransferase involved in cell wall biosynthesis
LLLVHHSLGYPNSGWLEALDTPKVLVYHNITPPHLLPEEGWLRQASILGSKQLHEWASAFRGAIGVSDTNSAELCEAHYANVTTIPLLVDIERILGAAWDPAVVLDLRDTVNLLFVGRISENKHQLKLVEMLSEFRKTTTEPVRLILAGATTSPAYLRLIEERIQALGLTAEVLLAGTVPQATLIAFYRSADAFVCMSEHEGFGMPLIEAALFNVPVLACAASSIPGTLGGGGLLLEDDNPRTMAKQLQLLLADSSLRRRVSVAQQRNLRRFEVGRMREQLAAYLHQLDCTAPRATDATAMNELQGYWQIEGPFDSSYSLAIVNRELACALKESGKDVGLRSLEGGSDFEPSDEFLHAYPDCAALAQRCKGTTTLPDVALRFCYPPHVADMQGKIKVLHSYGWEESGFPEEYVEEFNNHLDLITVLSHSVAKILRDAGVRVPIAVTGAGVDHLLLVELQTPAELQGMLRSFCFLHISSCFPRKGIDTLLWVYAKLFRSSDDVSLIIKTFPNPHNDVAMQLERFRQFDPDFPHVVLIERDYTEAELVGLYQSCHAFVAPSRGEGFGLPLAEAMLFNLPVITTAWGGQMDFCDDSNAWLCDYVFAKAQTHLEQTHSVWADPDIDHLTQLMRTVFQLSPEQRTRHTAAARRRILRHFTWDRVALATEQAVGSIIAERHQLRLGKHREPPRIGWISTWNKRCGIAAYSSFLTMAIPVERLFIFADRAEERTEPDTPNVLRSWTMNSGDNLDETFAAIIQREIKSVVIQYNFVFFSLTALGRLIERLKQAGISVHCFFHATGDVISFNQPVSLGSIGAYLAKADRLYVHSVLDLNRLKKFWLVNNIVLFPQGVLPTPSNDTSEVRERLGLQGKRIIASYGYLLPHKGLQQLIQAFAQLAAEDDSLHLLLVNALYPQEISRLVRDECVALIDNLQLTKRVTLVTDFLPDAQSLALLQLADLIVYPYQSTQESSSAAVRIGLASGRPVAVTPLFIFDDVADAVHILPGTKVADIAGGIQALLADPTAILQKSAKTAHWLKSCQWPQLSMRLLNMIDSIPCQGAI